MSIGKIENIDNAISLKVKKIVDTFVYSTGENPEKFTSFFDERLKAVVFKEETLNLFLSYVENAFSKQSLFKVLGDNSKVFDLLFTIFEHSQFLSEILIREPNLLFWVLGQSVLETAKDTEINYKDIKSAIEVFTTSEKKINAVKRYYRHNILRIGIRDLYLNSSVESITMELSALADSIVKISTEIARDDLKFKYGKLPKTDFTIFGLGKLGGGELNYSSDIDVIFAYKDDGEFKSSEKRVIHYYDYYQELGKNIIKLLTEITPEGYLYRVDTRLRPEGNSGPLVPSYGYLLSYYESRGEIWERQMLIKARVIYDENNFGADFIKNISPFVYPKFPLKNPLDEIAKIKFRIESGSDKSNNIKLCQGGIRDIEFSIQSLQLLNGGKIKSIRERNTLGAIKLLCENELITLKEAKSFREAYLFYRSIEHRLQIKQYRQTFVLPDEKRELLRLSKSLGFKNDELFKKKLSSNLLEIRKIFKKVFRIDIKETYADIERLLSGNGKKTEETLNCYELAGENIIDYIRMIVYGSKTESEKKYPASFSVLAKEMLSLVFNNLSNYPDKTRLLKNLEYLVSGRIDLESFLRQLKNEKYLKIILNICAYSNSYTRIISEQEKLLELLYNFGLNELPKDVINNLLPEEQKGISFIQSICKNIDKEINEKEFYFKLSDTVNSILKNTFSEIGQNKIKYAVFALGKLGSMEMGLNSDADLFFVFDAENEKESKNGIDFFGQVMQLLHSKSDSLFEVDLRLRPEGKNAPIAINKAAFIDYLKVRASFWERLALTRTRPVCGDAGLIKSLTKEINTFVYSGLSRNDIANAMDMRRNIEKKSVRLDINSLDLKTMEGGLVDIEFLVQIIKIIFSSKYPSIKMKNTPDVLSFIKTKKLFADKDIKFLCETYYYFRNVEKYIALNNLSERYILRKKDDRSIYNLIGFTSSEKLFETTMQKMRSVRLIYNQMFKKFERYI